MVLQNLIDSDIRTSEAVENSNTHIHSFVKSDNKSIQVKLKAFALNYVSNPVIQYNRDMKIVWANKRACALFERPLKEVVGHSGCQRLIEDLCSCIQCPVKAAFESARQYTAEVKTHNNRKYTITALPFLNTCGQVDNVIEIIKDKTYSRIVENLMADDYSEVASFSKKLQSLTEREREVMSLTVSGRSNKMMSEELCISPKTIEIHRSRMMKKLSVNSLAELVRLHTLFDFYHQTVPFALNK